MVNGCPLLNADLPVINGIEINSIKELYKQDPNSLRRFFESASDADQRRWVLLNTALFIDGLYLKITGTVATPIGDSACFRGEAAQAAHPRIIIDASPGASATIIEHHVSAGDVAPLNNSNTHIALGKDAQLEHYRVYATGAGATHLDSLDIHQSEGSRCRQFTIVLGGGLVRSSLEARLNQRGASLESFSLLVGHQERHVDCVNIVTHAAPDTRSRQTARAIASDGSRVIFNSKVIVNAGANGSDSKQSCRGLLLSPNAEIDTRPQLEIHADEVKCAHGATTGRLDPDMLFYMLSRGLDRETAQSLLVFAFLADVLTGMSVSLGACGDRERPDQPITRRANPAEIPMNNIALAKMDRIFDVEAARRQFPILTRMIHGKPLVYLDNGASAQRAQCVIDAVDDYERHHHANIHRGVHTLSQEATAMYEGARDRVQRFINARSRNEIIFVRGTTEAINLVAQSYARPKLGAGDEVLITHLEHHANIVPWQMVCEQTGAKLVVAPMDAHGEVHLEAIVSLMSARTKILACAHVSNALGTILPVRRIIAAAKARGITTLLDGAQAISHMPVDVQDLGCDFYAFSGHKMYGPTGVGVLYGREQLLDRMPPWQGGGEMILKVTFAEDNLQRPAE